MRNFKIESDFFYKDFRCVVVFQEMGFRCGYVGIPKNNKLHLFDYDDLDHFEVHGGLTYSGISDIYPIANTELNWIGFDCGHLDDGIDTTSILEYFPEKTEVVNQMKKMYSMFRSEDVIRTKEYVESECKKIINQVIEFESEDL